MKSISTFFLIFLFFLATCTSYVLASHLKTRGSVITIVINDQGFSSDAIIIKKETSVRWLAEGSNQYWPASDFHPTHKKYPDGGGCLGSKLDACRGLKLGESFSFKFDKTGTFGIHDHLHPGFTMTIQVLESDNQKSPNYIDGRGKIDSAQQDRALKEMAKRDPAKAWALLKKTFIVNGQAVGNGHTSAHVIGNEAYNKFGLSGIKICSDEFAFGCYHGVSEKMLLVLGKDSIKKIETECMSNLPAEKSQSFTGCIHGTGHGLVAWHAFDLEEALADCNVLRESNRNYCYNGVMMEYMESAPDSGFDLDDPWKLCLKFDGEILRLCGRYQIITSTSRFHLNNDKIIDVCTKAPNQTLKENCFHGFASHITQQARGDFEKIKKICTSIIDKSGRNTCFIYSADQVVFQEYNNWGNVSVRLCELVDLSVRDNCYTNINHTIKFYKKKLPEA